MTKSLSLMLSLILICGVLTGCSILNYNYDSGNETDANIDDSSESQTLKPDNEYLSDGVVNGTNSRKIVDQIVLKYDLYENNSGVQSKINKHWSYNGYKEKDNNYTKDYDVSADENLEIVIAHFATYDNDIDYLLECASLFNTEYINADEVKQWISAYKAEDGYVTKTFGDAEFVLNMTDYYDDLIKFELSIYALD